MIKTLLIISIFFLSACQSNNKGPSKFELVNEFKKSNEYKEYLMSDKMFSQVIITYRVEPIGIEISLANSGEANAFEDFIKNNTRYNLQGPKNYAVVEQ